LFASAVAPLLATLLRQIEVLKYAPHPESVSSGEELNQLRREADSTAEALKKIRIKTEAATKNVVAFVEAAKSIVDRLNEVVKNIEDAKKIIPAAITDIASGIRSSGAGVTVAFGTTADNICTGGAQVSAAFAATSSALGNFTNEAASSTATTKKMATELESLAKEAHATAGILKTLQELIDSVTDFIRPEKT
jgi:hypothetical protein